MPTRIIKMEKSPFWDKPNSHLFDHGEGYNWEKISDNDLVEKIRNDNTQFYGEIIKRYQGKLFAYLYRFVGEKEEAEDLLQNVFFKAYRNLGKYDSNRKFSSWIYRIAHNEAVNFIKRKYLRKIISFDAVSSTKDKLEISSTEDNAEESWIRKETDRAVDEAINRLPFKYRQVLALRYFSDKSYEEIGEILGRPVNTVGTLIKRAKDKLSVDLDNLE